MKATRKQKLKQKAEKQGKSENWKSESFDRVVDAMGLCSVFQSLPQRVREMFLEHYPPGLEVSAAEDSADEPLIQLALRDIRRLIKKPSLIEHRGYVFALALDDVFRGYYAIVAGVKQFVVVLGELNKGYPSRLLETMLQAQAIIDDPEENWVMELLKELTRRLHEIRDRHFLVDVRMISARFIETQKPEGGYCDRIVLRFHRPQPHVVPVDGSTRKAFPCARSWAGEGIRQNRWKCTQVEMAGKEELPVFIDRHAIDRLHQRIPLPNHQSLLHNIMVDCLEYPVLTPREPGKYLVDVRLGEHKVGYFVAQVLPDLVLIRTFLFLTMQGTPEADRLRDKLGLSRNDVERYKLDYFWTLTASNIADDPLLARVLAECGCGHLLSFLRFDVRHDWVERHGAKMKELFGIREAKGGFVVGQKWVRWSDASAGGCGRLAENRSLSGKNRAPLSNPGVPPANSTMRTTSSALVIKGARSCFSGSATMLTSAELDSVIGAVLRGDRDAFRKILRAYGLSLRSYIATHVQHLDDIDDLSQDVFLVAFRTLRQFRRGEDFGAWLRGIARNKVHDHFRSSARRHRALERFREEVVRVVEANLERKVSAESAWPIEVLLGCIGLLPERLRRVVRAGLEGDKPTELAGELMTTVGAVYRLHYRANQLLRDCMHKEQSTWTKT